MTNDVHTYWFRPFDASDIELLEAQAKQAHELEGLREYGTDGWRNLQAQRSFTGFHGERCLGCAGFMECWPSRWLCWAILSSTVSRNDMIWIHRTIRREIESIPPKVRRLEITVERGFPQAERWAYMLGFKKEGEMQAYDWHGHDHLLFAKVKA